MTTLYIKTHKITGLKYFGKTTKTGKAFEKYNGSGLHWIRHLKKHGKDIHTEVYKVFDETNNIQKLMLEGYALEFSEIYKISKSKKWANMKPENGLDGAAFGNVHSVETRAKISKAHTGKPFKPHTEETKRKISESNKDKPKSQTQINLKSARDKANGKYYNIYDSNNILLYKNIWRRDVIEINQSLLKTNIEKRLGDTKFSKIHLNRLNKMNMIGWYAIEIQKKDIK